MVQAIAIDDEPMALEVIRSLSEKVVFLKINNYFTNPVEAFNYLNAHKVDLLFLDIQMPDLTGLDLLKSLPNPPMVIFTTAYSEHATQSFEFDVIDYLLKPFSFPRFLKACNKAHEQFELRKHAAGGAGNAPDTTLFIKTGYDQVRVDVNAILYVESGGNYVQFVLEGRKITSRLTMSEAEALLQPFKFTRIHRSYIVGESHITKINKKSVWVKQVELPIGNGYSSEVEKITG